MARPLRLEVPGALYHVMARGNERKPIFRSDSDRELYLDLIARYRERHGFALLAYCLMGNHLHLALETGQETLSRTMASLHSAYSASFNRRHQRVGHLFQGRYKAMLVDRDAYGQQLLRYIHGNPVAAKLVPREESYAWSSARFYHRGGAPEWLDVDRGLRLFGRGREAARRAYRQFVRDADAAVWSDVPTHGQQVVGSDEFAETVVPASREPLRPRRRQSLEAIAREVAQEAGVPLAELQGPGRDRRLTRVRFAVALRARNDAGISISQTARFFNRDVSTMTRGVGRWEATEKAGGRT